MTTFALLLKAEVARLARKEIRAELVALRKATTQYRSQIAALKRRTQRLEQQLRQVPPERQKARPVPAEKESGSARRFSAKGFASMRKRLGLSAAELGLLIGVSDQSVYKWERNEVKPRTAQLTAIAAMRGLGKKEARARLAGMQQAA